MKKLIAMALILTMAGCGTVEGVGKDISSAARGVKSLF